MSRDERAGLVLIAYDGSRPSQIAIEQARQEGMRSSGVAVRADPSIWASIVATAHEHDARAVVVGSRGCSGLRSALLGSVSNALVHRCSRPVVVVHPPEDAALET